MGRSYTYEKGKGTLDQSQIETEGRNGIKFGNEASSRIVGESEVDADQGVLQELVSFAGGDGRQVRIMKRVIPGHVGFLDGVQEMLEIVTDRIGGQVGGPNGLSEILRDRSSEAVLVQQSY